MVKATLRKAQPPTPVPTSVPPVVTSSPAPATGPATLAELVDDPTPAVATELPPQHSHPEAGAVAVREPVYRSGTTLEGDGIEGEWTGDDLKFPQLKIVQGSGPLSSEFDLGTIIYGDTELLPPPSIKEGAVNPVIRFVPILLKRQWREKLSQDDADGGVVPRIASSIIEVEEYGGTTRWAYGKERPTNYWEDSARCLFLLELPATSQHPGFCLELDGKQYGVAVYYPSGGSYRDSAKVIVNTAQTSLLSPVLTADGKTQVNARGQILKRALYWKNFWTIGFSKKQAGDFIVWRPTVKLLKEETGPELRAYCAEVNAGAATAAAAAE